MLERIKTFLLESQAELKRVVWPKWKPISLKSDLWASTAVVIVAVIILAAIIGFYDLVYENVIMWLFQTAQNVKS